MIASFTSSLRRPAFGWRLGLLLLAAAASPPCAADAPAAGSGYHVEENVEYAKEPVSLKLDAHLPPGKKTVPAVILVHGGGWVSGDKTANFIQPLFPVLDQTGYAWFTIDYRLAPQYPYPACVDDLEHAIIFVKKNARRFHIDPKRIALMGESAGGHLVNLVGARNRPPADVAAVVSFYGPIDMLKLYGVHEGQTGPAPGGMKPFFEITELNAAAFTKLKEASPHTYLGKQTPPFLFIQGTKDPAVPYEQATLAVELFQKAGIPCDLITVQDGIHGVINWERDPKFQGYKPQMIDWLHRHLK